MSALSVRLAASISCHAWNADRSMLAICPNNSEVWLYTGCTNPDPTTWKVAQVLKEHELLVNGIDWHPVTNRIVTCAQDRNAFVWTVDPVSGMWSPTVVILQINRAAMAVKWSPDGNKFAVASSNKQVMVCWFDGVNNMWISKAVTKKAKSAVVALSWHPNSQILATASTDYKARVLCAYLDGIDGRPEAAQFGGVYPPFGDQIIDFEVSRAWINDVAWSSSGLQLAFVAHDGLLHIASFAPDGRTLPVIKTIKTAGLPAMRVAWLTERTLVTAGHNLRPDAFGADAAGNWSFLGLCDPKESATGKAGAATSSFDAAKGLFAAKSSRAVVGGGGASAASSVPPSRHQSAITFLQPFATKASGAVTALSTSSADGRVVVWDLTKAQVDAALLGL